MSIVAALVYILTNNMRVPFPASSPTLIICDLFDNSYSAKCEEGVKLVGVLTQRERSLSGFTYMCVHRYISLLRWLYLYQRKEAS